MRRLLLLAAMLMPAGAAIAQADVRVCDQPDGYIEVYKEFVTDWAAAKDKGALVDPELTDIAVWLVQYENRMMAGEPVQKLCREMIALRAASSFAEKRHCIFCQ